MARLADALPWLLAVITAACSALAGLAIAVALPLTASALLAGTVLRLLWYRRSALTQKSETDDDR